MRQKSNERTSGRVQMSNRLFAALEYVEAQKDYKVSALNALFVDQRSFGPLRHRGYIGWNDREKCFFLAEQGKEALYQWRHTHITKENASPQFSHYLRDIAALSGRFDIKSGPSKKPVLVRVAAA